MISVLPSLPPNEALLALYQSYFLQGLLGFALGVSIILIAHVRKVRAWPYVLVMTLIYAGVMILAEDDPIIRRWFLIPVVLFIIWTLFLAVNHYDRCTYNKETK